MASVVTSAREDSAALGALLDLLKTGHHGAVTIVQAGTSAPLPQSVLEVLTRAVTVLASGRGVDIVPVDRELTTKQAAELLDLPLPTLLGLLETGELRHWPADPSGRIPLDEVLAYQDRRSRTRREILADMTAEAVEMGGYDTPRPADPDSAD